MSNPRKNSKYYPEDFFDDVNDVEKWTKKNPGKKTYICVWCGIYTASKPRCNKCEEENEENS